MQRRQHEIPTHLNVEDKLMYGLTVRQFLYVLVGTSLSYAVWDQLLGAPLPLRVGVVAACLLVTAAVTLVRPMGRPLEEWLIAGCMYAAVPRRATWRPIEPQPTDWRPALGAWHELTPNPVWIEEDAP